ncbi:alpha/beta hydrolase [Pseudomonas sp. NPDC090755]|uniref:UilS family quorum-quenching N-acyl-homoserine lactonase n=1 Tax=Pseudomonas sp. NPDC090755 TaxID=3364481 RepID=UPI00383BC8D5
MDVTTHKLAVGIAATLRSPRGAETAPVIVLCHGFCGIQEVLLPAFAEFFTRAGFHTVTFDYRGFGASEGERGRLLPSLQIQDILAVIEWVKTQPGIDKHRIGLWGTSLGGCHVFGAAAENPDIKCIVSQLGFADGEKVVTGKMSAEEKAEFVLALDRMVEKKSATGKEMFVGITRVLKDEESKAFFEVHRTLYPAMDIKIPFLTVRETFQYKPGENAKYVKCPTLVVLAGQDSVNPPAQGLELYESVTADVKRLHVEPQARHYDIYTGAYFDRVAMIQSDWFNDNL